MNTRTTPRSNFNNQRDILGPGALSHYWPYATNLGRRVRILVAG